MTQGSLYTFLDYSENIVQFEADEVFTRLKKFLEDHPNHECLI